MSGPTRGARVLRETAETRVEVELELEGQGAARVATGLGFLDHMLAQLARHGGWNLALQCRGDLEVDDHHSVEDCALALGEALDAALGERRDIERFGEAHAPLDEALARCVVDVSSRPWAEVSFAFRRERLGSVATENLTHFVRSLAQAARLCVHLDVLRGENDHHKAEAGFKSLALALRRALAPRAGVGVPSTKEVLA